MDKDKALELAGKYKTPRYKEIERLERYIDGSIYEGRPDFFSPGSDTPLLERKPCCRYPLAQIAIRSHSDMVLGEGKWPRLKLHQHDDAGVDREQFEALIACIVEHAELRSRMREGLEIAMGARAVCWVGYVRRGRLGVQAFSGKACTLERNAEGDPIKLTVEYPYIEEYKEPVTNKWTYRVMLYRREVDEQDDKVYMPIEANNDGTSRPSQLDKTKSRTHGLGFCPVDWYAFLPPGGHDDALDGRSLHENQLSELDAINIAVSQRARAAHYAGDPQVWETGVGPDENPAPAGRVARGIVGAVLGPNGEPIFGLPNQARVGRKKGVGVVWTYSDVQARVGAITMPGDALKALDDHIQDLVRKVSQAFCYVPLDPEKAHTVQASSGRALEILIKPQVDFDCRIREDFGEHAICSVVSLLLRIAYTINKRQPGSVYLDGLTELQGAIEGFEREIVSATAETESAQTSAYREDGKPSGPTMWLPPPLDLEWGPLFVDDGQALKFKTDAAIEAKDKGLISRRTATACIAHGFGVADIDEELADIDTEQAATDAKKASQQAQFGQQAPDDGLPDGVKPAGAAKSANAPQTPNAPTTPPSSTPPAPKSPPPAPGKAGAPASTTSKTANAPSVPVPPKAGTQDAIDTALMKSPGVVKQAPVSLHQRAASAAGVAETVYQLLSEDYPKDSIEWVRAAHWEGPLQVALDQVDFQNRAQWQASEEPDRVDEFVQKIADGEMKPIVLVNEPNDNKLRIVDGHHRALAYEKLKQPVMAYVAHVGTISGPWDALHSSQKKDDGTPRLTSMQKPKGSA